MSRLTVDEIMRGLRIVYDRRKEASVQCERCPGGLNRETRAVVMIYGEHLCELHARDELRPDG